jgi:hypothetical protein
VDVAAEELEMGIEVERPGRLFRGPAGCSRKQGPGRRQVQAEAESGLGEVSPGARRVRAGSSSGHGGQNLASGGEPENFSRPDYSIRMAAGGSFSPNPGGSRRTAGRTRASGRAEIHRKGAAAAGAAVESVRAIGWNTRSGPWIGGLRGSTVAPS